MTGKKKFLTGAGYNVHRLVNILASDRYISELRALVSRFIHSSIIVLGVALESAGRKLLTNRF